MTDKERNKQTTKEEKMEIASKTIDIILKRLGLDFRQEVREYGPAFAKNKEQENEDKKEK